MNNNTNSLSDLFEKDMQTINENKNGTESAPVNENSVPDIMSRFIPNNHPVDMSKMQVSDPSQLFADSPKRELKDPLMEELDLAVGREKNSISKRINAIEEMQYKEFLAEKQKEEDAAQDEEDKFALGGTSDADDAYFNDTDTVDIASDNSNNDPVIPEPKKVYNIKDSEEDDIDLNLGLTDDDISKDEDEDFDDDPLFADNEDIEKKNNQIIDDLKKDIKSKTNIKKIDISKFSIAKKSMNAQKIMKLAADHNAADWVLYSAKRPISVTGLSGPEILKLNPENSSRNRLNTFKEMYHIIYDHIIDSNKPNFDAWLKQTRFTDLPHLYFAVYMATFGNSNYINQTCPECKKIFIQDIKLEDMVAYKDDAIKNEVRDILKMDTNSSLKNDEYPVDLVPISDSYVFGIHSPTLYSVIIETASLSDQFIEKYSDLIDIVSFIDSIYYIDKENQQLIPVDTKPDPTNQAKTSARRIKVFYDIIRTLDSEEFYSLRGALSDYEEEANKISYKIPGCKCPNCGKEIPENTDIGPDAMLFTRHRLAAISNL